MDYLFHFFCIFCLLILIVFDCVVFTNAIENLGEEYDLEDGVVGSILAAVGTALPETIVPLVAIIGAVVLGQDVSVGKDIAFGAVLGSPFLLSTFAFFVSGLAVVCFTKFKLRNLSLCINTQILKRDIKYFLISYTLAVLCAFISNQIIKYIVSIILIFYYFIYVLRTFKKNICGCSCSNEIDSLYFEKFLNVNKKMLIFVQVIFSLFCLVFLSHFFIKEIEFFAFALNINPLIISLLLSPIATELPECFNSVIWMKASKDSLAISNISGALVFQSCIPVAIGVAFTSWNFTITSAINVILVYISLGTLLFGIYRHKVLTTKHLLFCGIFYLIYILYILTLLI